MDSVKLSLFDQHRCCAQNRSLRKSTPFGRAKVVLLSTGVVLGAQNRSRAKKYYFWAVLSAQKCSPQKRSSFGQTRPKRLTQTQCSSCIGIQALGKQEQFSNFAVFQLRGFGINRKITTELLLVCGLWVRWVMIVSDLNHGGWIQLMFREQTYRI
jgi:hypothetical protein